MLLNINPNCNFLKSLIGWLCDEFQGAVSDVLIILPSKRSCLEFEFIYNALFPGRAQPKITSISQISHFHIKFISKKAGFDSNFEFLLQKEQDDLRYNVELSKKIRSTAFFQNVTATQSFNIAASLKNLFDDLSKSNISISDLEIDDPNISSHRQFAINIIKDFYIDFKRDPKNSEIMSSSELQKLKIQHYTHLLQKCGLDKKVIIAGSTGSVDYMKDFIKTIFDSSNGFVITNGSYKRDSKPEATDPASLAYELLSFLKTDKIREIQGEKVSSDQRFNFLANNLFSNSPGRVSNEQIDKIKEDFEQNFQLIKAGSEIQEVKSVISKLTSQDSKDKKIAIICPSSNLMLLTKKFLKKTDLKFNDHEKYSLLELKFIKIFLLIAKSFDEKMSSVSILAVLKSAFSKNHEKLLIVSKFEKEIIRTYRSSNNIGHLLKLLEERKGNEFLLIFETLTDLYQVFQSSKKSTIEEIFEIIAAFIEKVTEQDFAEYFNPEQLVKINEIKQLLQKNHDIRLEKNENYEFFNRIFSFSGFSRDFDQSYNIEISTSIEARLINYDMLFFMGLNKGSYPALEKDNWISGKVRKELGIFNNDKKISLAAYDFCNLLSNKQVVLSFCENISGAKVSKSPFLLKLEAVLQKNQINIKSTSSDRIIASKKNSTVTKSPKIELNDHVKSFSASDIDLMTANPYSFYAKKILKLKKQDEIDYEPGNAEFGSFIHKFIEKISESKNSDYQNLLNKLFNSFYKSKESKLVWLPKAQKIIENYLKHNLQFEKGQDQHEKSVSGKFEGFTISAKIDRIHIDEDNEVSIIDYKTGVLSSGKDVKMHKNSQLLIYALLLSKDPQFRKIASVKYWKLSQNTDPEIKNILEGDALQESICQIEENLMKLMQFFSDSKATFNAKSPEKFLDDYFHLARINKS